VANLREQATTKFGDWFMFDIGLAAQNICLAAHSLNLGTAIIGPFGHNRVKEILHIPAEYEMVALIPMGYPAYKIPHSHRKEISVFVYYETF